MKKTQGISFSASICFSVGFLLFNNSAFAFFATAELFTTNLLTNKFSSTVETQFDETAFVEQSLGVAAFSERPTQAKSISKKGGIVSAYLQTGLTPFDARTFNSWQENYHKTADDAAFNFNISTAFLQIGSDGINDANAHFSFGVFLERQNEPVVTAFDHLATISGHGGYPGIETFNKYLDNGPLIGTYIEYLPNNDRASFEKYGLPYEPSDRVSIAELEFAPYSGSVDLSNISVGEEFTVKYILLMNVHGLGGESWATARFSDPADFENGGISSTYTGITPILTNVPLPAAVVLFSSGLITLFSFSRKSA